MANYNEIYKSQMDWANVFVRTGNFPLDRSSIFGSYEDALLYAKGDGTDSRGLGLTSYVGQIIAVYENSVVSIYKIVGNDIMDNSTNNVLVQDRNLEELISRSDVNSLIAASIISSDFNDAVKEIISNEKITTDKIINEEKINIIGTPLAKIINPNNSLDIVIDSNNLFTILKQLFEQELYPKNIQFFEGTVTPFVEDLNISTNLNATKVEVGTQCVINSIVATKPLIITTPRQIIGLEYGYSLQNNNMQEFTDTIIEKEAEQKYVENGLYKLNVVVNKFNLNKNFYIENENIENCIIEQKNGYVEDGANKITVVYSAPYVAATFPSIPTIYLCSNLHKTQDNENYIINAIDEKTLIASQETKWEGEVSITGIRYGFMGGIKGSFSPSSDAIRKLEKTFTQTTNGISFTSTNETDCVVISFPKTWGNLKSVIDENSKTNLTDNFVKSLTNVCGANQKFAIDYNVYIYTPDITLKKGFSYTIKIS